MKTFFREVRSLLIISCLVISSAIVASCDKENRYSDLIVGSWIPTETATKAGNCVGLIFTDNEQLYYFILDENREVICRYYSYELSERTLTINGTIPIYYGYNGGIFGPFQYEILNLNKDYLSLYYTDDNYTLNFKKTD